MRESFLFLDMIMRPLLDLVLASPLNDLVLVPMARSMMVKTAEENSVPWSDAKAWISSLEDDWESLVVKEESKHAVKIPDYYRAPFHAYQSGNLCMDAAFEQEIASAAVGARNYPLFGRAGEDAFRGAFDQAFEELGATGKGTILDLGCGTGASSRRLARRFPESKVVGIDLSPFFIAVGKKLLVLKNNDRWINDDLDQSVSFVRADIAHLPYEDASVDVCQLSLVVHELPPREVRRILDECARVLKPNGQLWISEMDFETPGFKNLRENPVLFSFIRSTEPYLDEYADYNARGIIQDLETLPFDSVKLRAATGRHFALVATKSSSSSSSSELDVDDRRAETAMHDTHLATFKTKQT